MSARELAIQERFRGNATINDELHGQRAANLAKCPTWGIKNKDVFTDIDVEVCPMACWEW